MPDTREELLVLERDIEREWWWLNGALHAAAQVNAERPYGDPRHFREMQAQAREVDRRRVEIAMRIAENVDHRQASRPAQQAHARAQ
jgi:hypothetical protein